jgi:hypothetical protein
MRITKLIKRDILEQYVACGSFFAEKCKQKFEAELRVKIIQRIQWRLLVNCAQQITTVSNSYRVRTGDVTKLSRVAHEMLENKHIA